MKKFSFKVLPANSNKGFALLAGVNRDITPSHVTTIAKAVERKGTNRVVLVAKISFISGKTETYIIDGQHLFMALIRLGWEIPYKEIEIVDYVDLAQTLAEQNASSKSWCMQDYIKVWSNVNEDYRKLSHYFKVYDIELSQIAEILMEGTITYFYGGNNTMSKRIKQGTFSVTDEARAVEILDYITDALKIVPRVDRMSNKMFISTYVGLVTSVKDYDHKQFLANLKLHKDKFRIATQDPEEYKKLFKTLI